MSNRDHQANTTSQRKRGLFAVLSRLLALRGSGAPSATRSTALSASLATGALLVFGALMPAAAAAYATPGPAPTPGPAGLPDGRVYEQVTPQNKNGNSVGGVGSSEGEFGLAEADGNALLFLANGAMGSSSGGIPSEFLARRTPGSGWATTSAVPRQQGVFNVTGAPTYITPSADFSHFLFSAPNSYAAADQSTLLSSPHMFLSEDPAAEPAWLAQPTIPDPVRAPRIGTPPYQFAGATPDLSTVYFTYGGTLLPEDASRAPYVGEPGALSPWGFYEWSHGTLAEAGVLPDGSLDPRGAVPAAIADSRHAFVLPETQAQTLDNEVSADGSRAFFVSPDPQAATPADPPELYAREAAPDGAKSTVLVSQDPLLPKVAGLPAAAPNGVVSVTNTPLGFSGPGATYVYASPDGSRAFFKSTDQLTAAAPADASVKEYEFDLESGALTYLPGVAGPVVVTSPDGTRFLFENGATSPPELDLWTEGPGGGGVTPITPLPAGGDDLSGARSSTDGSVFVFRTNSPLPGGFNNAGGFEQVYRYEVASNVLSCLSCPPAGVAPSGDARVSYDSASSQNSSALGNDEPGSTLDTRVLSPDGARVFFDTPDPLVPADTNGRRDVYEWESGHVYLISSGKSQQPSTVLDSSASGDDLFFTTTSGLVPGDVDDVADAYDARVPRPGDNPPPPSNLCQGESCQGSSPVLPPPLTPPTSTVSGFGNLHPKHSHPKKHRRKHPKKAGGKHSTRTDRSSAIARTGNDRRIG